MGCGYADPVKQLTTFMILVAFGLTLDRAFNEGYGTVVLAEAFDEAKDWTLRSVGRVAETLYGSS